MRVNRFKKKLFSLICILTIILSNAIPANLAIAAGNSPKVEVSQNEKKELINEPNGSDKEKKRKEADTETKKQVTFGPYRDLDQKHAYEPFKEKEDKDKLGVEIGYRKDRLLIKFRDEAKVSAIGQLRVNGKAVDVTQKGIKKVESLLPQNGKATEKAAKLEKSLKGWTRAYVVKDKKIEDVVESLKKDVTVESVEYDYIRSVDSTEVPQGLNDENLGQQWHMETAAVKEAWNELESQGIHPGGSRDVVVAVIDTGVDYNHPDLKGNMWVNTGEIPGNGYDDDQNGFVDDIYGVTTVGNSWAGESGDPNDDHGHGTHVAGIIAAQGNNEIGGAGVAYNAQIMAIKAAQSSGALSSSDIAQAVYYAVDKGADVINMSFGGYGRSTVEEDALQVAFGTSVLVAAAGNDAKPNLPHPFGADMYPAAYNWVLGVMAEQEVPAENGDYLAGFSNWDFKPQDSHEYEVMAPGADIYSTLPNGKYAKWSGTSMAAPVVSGIAALVRSKFSDKNSYSTRFIMGQIAATGTPKQGITYDMKKPPMVYKSVNALQALTNTPKPQLSYLEHYLFDKKGIAAENDEDGVVDAGETIDIAMVIRNHWGKADNVEVKIDTLGSGGMADPYVTLVTDMVNYGAVGNFAIDDNGLIYENDYVTGVNLPFKLQAAPNTPNDHIVPINVTITARNGFDPHDTTVYTYKSGFSFMVRNGVELPGVIDKDMTLTKDKYWIVPNSTLIREGATVTVEPGTQIQFWSAEPEDPYAEKSMAYIEVRGKFLVNGTAEEPVEMFSSSMWRGYEVKVYSTNNLEYHNYVGGFRGYAEFNYVKVMNPNIAIQKVDHSYFSQDLVDRLYKRLLNNGVVETSDYYGPFIFTDSISNSKFYGLGIDSIWNGSANDPNRMLNIYGKSKGNLFDSNLYFMDELWANNNVYLKNYKLIDSQYGERKYWVSKGKWFGSSVNPNVQFQTVFPVKYNQTGSTYMAVEPNAAFSGVDELKIMQEYAKELGGHIVAINDAEENEIVRTYINNYLIYYKLQTEYPSYDYYDFAYSPVIIGLNDFEEESSFNWANGEEVHYTNWDINEPNNSYKDAYTNSSDADFVSMNRSSGKWYDYFYSNGIYIIEIPGVSNVTGVTLDKTSLTLGAGGGTEQLKATIIPAKATNKLVNWSSSNPEVASVDQNGAVTPLTVGKATITVTTEDGGLTASSEVNVIEIVPATGVILNKASLELSKGLQEMLFATVTPVGATDKRVKWSTNDESIATVDENGIVTGISNGTTTISVTTLDGGFIASTDVTVLVPVEGIKLDKEFLRLVLGDSPVKINPLIQPDTATNKNVKWGSSNENVVKVDENGYVTPIGVGTAKITVTSEQGDYSTSSMVTVWEKQVTFNTIDLASGMYHSLAVNEDGTVWSWGSNENGRLGDGTSSNRLTPVKVYDLTNIKSVAAGYNHSLALTNDGIVFAWGYGGYGQLGNGSYASSYPNRVQNLNGITLIAAGRNYSVVLKSDGTVWSWGENEYGQLGDGTTINRWAPVQVNNLTNVKAIYARNNTTYAIKNDGTIWAWGLNGNGQIGDGTWTSRKTPVQVKNISNVKSIAAGVYHVLALKTDGTVWGWGSGGYGQLGGYSESYTPIQIPNLYNVSQISAGAIHSVVLKEDQSVWTFGNNQYGQLGNGNTSEQWTPSKVDGILAKRISSGERHSIFVNSDGTVWSFGLNNEGQLGNLSTDNSTMPVQTLFGILPDTEMPQLVSSSPENNAVNVPLNSSIKLTFNEGLKLGDSFPLISLKDQNNETISLKSKTIENNVLILEPISQLSENASYTLTIPSQSITDVFNNPYNGDIYLTFTTSPNFSTASIMTKSFSKPLSYFDLIEQLSNGKKILKLTRKKATRITAETIAEVKEPELAPYKTEKDETIESGIKPVLSNNIATFSTSTEITQSFIDEKKKEFINSGVLSTITDNAILNRWWDPNVEHWMRFTSENGEENKRFLSGNYWGTTNLDLIEKALIHFNDFRNMEEIIYKPILTAAPESAYPFVTDIYVSTESQERATKVGSENIEVHVTFNRDMDVNVQPQVSFGPDMPTTDYTVHGVNGGWVSPRHWVGSMKITSMTGDGYQFFRVAGAVAADDPWLVTGNDTERFRFEIVTSGTEAMNLQASGAEGKVVLSWSQDDFETLAGYNIYRSESRDGYYEKMNSSVIPSEQKVYEDTSVIPGKMYFYKFTVVKTNLSESEFSNIASAAPVDTINPVISHAPIMKANVGQLVQVFADVTDNVKVEKVTLFYKNGNDTTFKQKEMVKTTNNRYSITLEGATILAPSVDYYIEATDGSSKALHGNALQPHKMMISDQPTITSVTPSEGPETGGTKVVINGANFKQGATVQFGQAAASNVVFVNANQITAVTPAHYPAKVDVQVKNPDGTVGKLLSGFTFVSEGVQVAVGNASGNPGDIVEVPILINTVSGLRSADFKLKFDSSLIAVEAVTAGNLTKNFSLASNKNVSGEVQVSMASSTAVNGSGTIATVTFKVLDSEVTSSSLTLDSPSFNSGSIKVIPVSGEFSIGQTYKVQGTVNYYSNYLSLNNVDVSLMGQGQYQAVTDVSGVYNFEGVKKGDYHLVASKKDDINGISAYDASLILQAAVNLTTLNEYQRIAADVDRNGKIDALDAAYVLEKSVDLITLPFPGAGEVWTFLPNDRTLNVTYDQFYQNFTAILLGDVNGDWGTNEANLASAYTVGESIRGADGTYSVPIEYNVGEAELYSAKLSLSYDPAKEVPVVVEKTDATRDYSVVSNYNNGILEIALAGSTPIKGSGELIQIKMKALSKERKQTATKVNLLSANINDKGIILKSFKVNKEQEQKPKTKVLWTADVLGDGLTYSWVLYNGKKGVDKQGFAKQNYFEYVLSEPGEYNLLMLVRNQYGEEISQMSETITVLPEQAEDSEAGSNDVSKVESPKEDGNEEEPVEKVEEQDLDELLEVVDKEKVLVEETENGEDVTEPQPEPMTETRLNPYPVLEPVLD
jgi:alpha-tubulin suppressor-like RCC1 family protein/subtilisin family serine protease